jgi:hypothetical protein
MVSNDGDRGTQNGEDPAFEGCDPPEIEKTLQLLEVQELAASMSNLTERAGFEPAVGTNPTQPFQGCSISRSDTSPHYIDIASRLARTLPHSSWLQERGYWTSQHCPLVCSPARLPVTSLSGRKALSGHTPHHSICRTVRQNKTLMVYLSLFTSRVNLFSLGFCRTLPLNKRTFEGRMRPHMFRLSVWMRFV